MSTPEQLQQAFGIDGIVRFDRGNGGLTRATVTLDHASAEVYLLGAHVTRYAAAGREVLFVSARSNYEIGKPIRGGVPICFPWFGPRAGHPESPMHGFARLREFAVESVTRKGDDVELTLKLEADDQTRAMWPADFVLRHRITIGSKLTMALEVQNTGGETIEFEEALHTYFSCDDINRVVVSGLGGVRYIDKVDGLKEKTQEPAEIRFTGETDRVYLATRDRVTIENVSGSSSVIVEKENSNATVVWNPWIAKAAALPDFGDEEWKTMLCVETCNVGRHAVQLPAGGMHRMKAIISVQ